MDQKMFYVGDKIFIYIYIYIYIYILCGPKYFTLSFFKLYVGMESKQALNEFKGQENRSKYWSI